MDEVSQIREKIDLVAFISEFITVKKAGRNFRAVCPFHNEKSPSFMISPERQIWHCFGCGKGGDVYSFLMEYERLEFPEALRTLAKRTGVELANRQFDSGFSSKKETIYKLNGLAKEYYHYVLTKHPAGEKAREYLKKRGVTQKVIETFQLGFAAATGNALVRYLLDKKRFPSDDILEAGLAAQRGRTLVDFFRDRLMFPLIDHRDNVVGFAGRVLEGDVPSKYINTRETLAYHKGEHVFGLNVTKDAIRRENQAIIVEGEFDVISCFQHGIGNVVAVKGTALTEQQVNLLGRFAQKITFCFDDDAAGQEAIKRSLVVVEKKNITPTVIVIPDGKDPDEALKNEPGLFKKAVKEDMGAYDYLFTKTFSTFDPQTAPGKKAISDTMLPFLVNIKNEIIKEHYLRKLSTDLGTSYESIIKEMQRLEQRPVAQPVKEVVKQKRSREEILEEYLLALIIQSDKPRLSLEKAVEILKEAMTRERAYQKILFHLLSHFEETEHFDGKHFGDKLPKELVASYDTSLLFPLPTFDDQKKILEEITKTARQLKRLYLQRQMKSLAEDINHKEKNGTDEEIAALKQQYSHLTTLLDVS